MISGPIAEPKESDFYESPYKDGAHYNIYKIKPKTSMQALRCMFPDGECNGMNFVLFSTSGVHGLYTTIEEIEHGLKKYGENPEFTGDWPEDYHGDDITILIIHPRIVCLRWGNIKGITLADIPYLKKLRETSIKAMATIGMPE